MLQNSKNRFLKDYSFSLLTKEFPLFVYHYGSFRPAYLNFVYKTVKSSYLFSFFKIFDSKFFRGNSLLYTLEDKSKFNSDLVKTLINSSSDIHPLFIYYKGIFFTKNDFFMLLQFRSNIASFSLGFLFFPFIVNFFGCLIEPMLCFFRISHLSKS